MTQSDQANSLHGFEGVEADVEEEVNDPGRAAILCDQSQLYRVGQSLPHLIRAAGQIELKLFCCVKS